MTSHKGYSIICLSFILLFATSTSWVTACPDFCTCFDTFVTCTDFKSLDLTFMPPTADTLVLSQGEMEEIPPAFFARASNLKVVEIVNFDARVVRGGAFRGLSNLDLLSITSSSFDIVEPDGFSGIHHISSLRISDSHFGRVGKHAFAEITDVGEWRLWSCYFTTISDEAFFGLKDVHTLQIYQNNISYIGHDIFAGSANLDYINFYKNYIRTAINGSMTTAVDVVEHLVFFANTLECTCDIAWVQTEMKFRMYLSSNECVFPGTYNARESTFRLSDVSMHVLCPVKSVSESTTQETILHTMSPFVIEETGDDWPFIVDSSEEPQDNFEITSMEGNLNAENSTHVNVSALPTELSSFHQSSQGMVSTSSDLTLSDVRTTSPSPSSSTFSISSISSENYSDSTASDATVDVDIDGKHASSPSYSAYDYDDATTIDHTHEITTQNPNMYSKTKLLESIVESYMALTKSTTPMYMYDSSSLSPPPSSSFQTDSSVHEISKSDNIEHQSTQSTVSTDENKPTKPSFTSPFLTMVSSPSYKYSSNFKSTTSVNLPSSTEDENEDETSDQTYEKPEAVSSTKGDSSDMDFTSEQPNKVQPSQVTLTSEKDSFETKKDTTEKWLPGSESTMVSDLPSSPSSSSEPSTFSDDLSAPSSLPSSFSSSTTSSSQSYTTDEDSTPMVTSYESSSHSSSLLSSSSSSLSSSSSDETHKHQHPQPESPLSDSPDTAASQKQTETVDPAFKDTTSSSQESATDKIARVIGRDKEGDVYAKPYGTSAVEMDSTTHPNSSATNTLYTSLLTAICMMHLCLIFFRHQR